MKLVERQQGLDAELLNFHGLWHPQPFREPRPQWCERWPSLFNELMGLPEADIARLNDDSEAALALLARHIPAVSTLSHLADLPVLQGTSLPERSAHWAWEILGASASRSKPLPQRLVRVGNRYSTGAAARATLAAYWH